MNLTMNQSRSRPEHQLGREYLEFEVEEPLPDFDYNVLLGIDETDVIKTMLVIYLYF